MKKAILYIAILLGVMFGPAFASPDAALTSDQRAAVVAAYQKAKGAGGIEKRPIAALPANLNATSIDVSDRIRSASFGHKTWLLVPAHKPAQFYVRYGGSTNSPERFFGPFSVP